MPDRLTVVVHATPSPFHVTLSADAPRLSAWAQEVWGLTDQVVGAAWVEQRVLAVCEALLSRRLAALAEGAHRLGPLTQRDLARDAELEPADVSRVVRHVELSLDGVPLQPQALFSPEVGQTGLSGVQLRALLLAHRLAAPDDSDAAVAEALGGAGVAVHRRTIANARADLGLAPGGRRGSNPETGPGSVVHAVGLLPGHEQARERTLRWVRQPMDLDERVAGCRSPVAVARPSRLPGLVATFAEACADELLGAPWESLSPERRSFILAALEAATRAAFATP